jgi:hypothetical protein
MLFWRGGARARAAAWILPWLGVDCGQRPVEHASAASAGLVLVGHLEGVGIDPGLCEARCRPLRFEDPSESLSAGLDGQGRFEFRGLADADYLIEVVARANPSLVVACAEYVRPRGAELVIEADPALLFGAAASFEFSAP